MGFLGCTGWPLAEVLVQELVREYNLCAHVGGVGRTMVTKGELYHASDQTRYPPRSVPGSDVSGDGASLDRRTRMPDVRSPSEALPALRRRQPRRCEVLPVRREAAFSANS